MNMSYGHQLKRLAFKW